MNLWSPNTDISSHSSLSPSTRHDQSIFGVLDSLTKPLFCVESEWTSRGDQSWNPLGFSPDFLNGSFPKNFGRGYFRNFWINKHRPTCWVFPSPRSTPSSLQKKISFASGASFIMSSTDLRISPRGGSPGLPNGGFVYMTSSKTPQASQKKSQPLKQQSFSFFGFQGSLYDTSQKTMRYRICLYEVWSGKTPTLRTEKMFTVL